MRVFILTFSKFGGSGIEVACDVFANDEKEAVSILKKNRYVVGCEGTNIEVLKEITKPKVGRWYPHIPDYDDEDGQVEKRRKKKRVSKRGGKR